ncbi:TonB-dependent receptor [Steroidobacter agaridevorans]|uniref:TonB-dependent receptor n=1 Tax=Steroidobacter agaridevorans TaxID=2695856 RepID=A0A829YA10_9GAMM|nr:TonB-dependent receptor [Steroidobacter agaridevorans]GFE80147.1 TonB-dependent receptor [Steroidobacter agaridevorans]GFE89883.1 TonB-dependent receptor [Steroidobacter agaridevorans]
MKPKPSLTLRYAVILALAVPGAVLAAESAAQEAQTVAQSDAPADAVEPLQGVTVTGSRIARDGYDAPSPLTVIGVEAFTSTANSSLNETLTTIPAFVGGYNLTSGTGLPGFNRAGVSAVNLRGLGEARTLVLLDGQRAVGSLASGIVDVDNFPQQLIKSVEVVTGGASAVYGSDAVAGVVNFILDREFTGFKGEVSGGATSYGDAENFKISLAGGFPFAEGRGHVLLSGELTDNQGIRGVGDRSWARTTTNYIVNPQYNGTNGQPQLILRDNVFLSTATHGGVISAGPLRGLAFGEGGQPYVFNYGEGAGGFFMSGGDYRSTLTTDAYSLLPEHGRKNLFARVSYDLTDNINVFAQFSRGVTDSYGIAFPHYQVSGGPVVQSGNPFIPAEVQAQMTTLGVQSFQLGTMNYDMPWVTTDTERAANRYVVGAEGRFGLLGRDWKWDAYAQLGKTKSYHSTYNVRNIANYNRALDAVRDPRTGAIVCRSTLTAPNNGCVPWNPMGTGVNDELARNYVLGTAYSEQTTTQEVYAASITGDVFNNWAGPVSMALSVEHRKEEATVDPDPVAAVSGWHSGSHMFLDAGYDVSEAAVEVLFPLLSGLPFAHNWELNAAFRYTDYEVSGSVDTWKIGTTYAVTPGFRLRTTMSRDIRAPSISELFQEQNYGLITILDPLTGQTVSPQRIQTGNPSLVPEVADTFTAGFVLQPEYAPGLSFSVDYWKVEIDDSIQQILGQNIVRLCYEGFDSLCSRIYRDGNNMIYRVEQGNFNIANQEASGVDIEASYNFSLSSAFDGAPGDVALRLMGTHYIENVVDDTMTLPTDSVGAVNAPENVYTAQLNYDLDRFSAGLTGRYFDDTVLNNNAFECTSGCPVSTSASRTYDTMTLDGGFYLDLSLAYRFDNFFGPGRGKLFANIRNLLNEDPELVPQSPLEGLGYIYSRSEGGRWDKLGRVYRVGMEFSF